jgi:hypothetical protein
VDASLDVTARVALRTAAALVAFPVALVVLGKYRPRGVRDIAAAGGVLAALVLSEAAVMLAWLPTAALTFAYVAVGAAAVAMLAAGLSRASALLAAAAILKYVISIIFVQAWLLLVQ